MRAEWGAAHGLSVHSGGHAGPCIHFHMEMRGQADTGREREGEEGGERERVSSSADMTANRKEEGKLLGERCGGKFKRAKHLKQTVRLT